MQEHSNPLGTQAKVAIGVGFLALWVILTVLLVKLSPSFAEGGWGMWPILLVGMIMVVIAVDRTHYLFFRARLDPLPFTADVQKYLMRGDAKQALDYCRSKDQPLAAIVGAGLAELHGSDQDVQEAVDEAALYELPRIEKRTGYLAMIGNIATLLGLLGTIVGLIKSFAGVSLDSVKIDDDTIARAALYKNLVPACETMGGRELVVCISENKATVLAKGISEAMNCTAFGLLVGILSLIAFSVLNGRTQNMLDRINQTSVGLLNLAVLNKKSMDTDQLGGKSVTS